jgi:sugar phosphate isomerase/epimerase
MVVHPGFSGLGTRAKKRLVSSVDKLLNATIDYGVKICLENMPNFQMNLFLDEDEIEFFLSKLNRSDLCITYDTSHLWTNDGNVGVFWERFHERIKNVHIVENFDKNSDTHPDLGTGKVNFPKIIDIIRGYGYKGALVIELASAKNLLKSIQFIKQILSS